MLLTIPFLIVLMGCSLSKVSYVKPTVSQLPEKPVYYDVRFGKGDYCLDEGNAKNMLKNRELERDYIAQLEAIIRGMK